MNVVARDDRDAARAVGHDVDRHRALGDRGDRADPGRRRGSASPGSLRPSTVMEACVLPLNSSSGPGERRPARAAARRPARRGCSTTAAHCVELLVGQPLEQVHAAAARLNGHSARYSWISDTAIEPSPTALATRLIERARTSPATNTPGHRRLQQVRVALERPARRPSRRAPARMKPRSSRATTPSSQSVRGAAPMNTNAASTVLLALAVGVADAQRVAGARRPRPRPPARWCARRCSGSPRSARSGSATSTSPAPSPRTSIVTRPA